MKEDQFHQRGKKDLLNPTDLLTNLLEGSLALAMHSLQVSGSVGLLAPGLPGGSSGSFTLGGMAGFQRGLTVRRAGCIKRLQWL